MAALGRKGQNEDRDTSQETPEVVQEKEGGGWK